FNPEGSEIHLRPAGDYVVLGQPVDFYTVLDAARARGEVALGYRKAARSNLGTDSGLNLNPVKSAPITFAEADHIIILADA
ncbi:MAG TPA: potassium transporter TrkA, partial [Anaerolineae bacterium]|nr:potassium transporter TrkA [Anaerolineae bacterium]